jgi:HD superfamily phosphohydrolase
MDEESNRILAMQLDVACALGAISLRKEFQYELPAQLELPDWARNLLTECIDSETYEDDTCRIRDDFENKDNKYILDVGQDQLALQPSGHVFVGGSGVTIQLYDKDLARSFAFKAPRISVLAYDQAALDRGIKIEDLFDSEYKAFQNERQLSRRLSHENVAQHIFGDYKTIQKGGLQKSGLDMRFPYSVSEWIDGARPLHKYLVETKATPLDIIRLIRQSFRGLRHVHDRRILHWDLKADNVLVSEHGLVKIIDFGNAKFLDDLDSEKDIGVTTTRGKYPASANFDDKQGTAQGSRRFHVTLPHITWNHPYIDLWMLGQEWNRCLSLAPVFLEDKDGTLAEARAVLAAGCRSESNADGNDVWDCLDIVFSRLLHSLDSRHVSKCMRDDKSFDSSSIYYESAHELLNEIHRIEPLLGGAQKVPELLVSLGDIVRLPVTGNSIFTKRVAKIVDSELARPTKLHLQLAQVREVYPGATHTRFEHLLGTVTTASYILRSLYLNEMNAFWRVSATDADARAVLLAALLHDVGHLAYGHFIEEMHDLMGGAGHVDFIRSVLTECVKFTQSISNGTSDEFQPHNTTFIIRRSDVEELVSIIRNDWCNEEGREGDLESELLPLLDRVSAILGKPGQPHPGAFLDRPGTKYTLNALMKSIVNGPLDADKLDYLRRDSLHAGVMFANGIDLERFFESLRVCVDLTPGGGADPVFPSIGVSEKGVAAVETIVTARYHLFSIVYWHRTVRCITAMLQRVFAEIYLSLNEDEWTNFRRTMLHEFRTRDDREALEWLREQLEEMGRLPREIGEPEMLRNEPVVGQPATVGSLMRALLGARDDYFEMAFELSYSGFVATDTWRGETPSGQLHDKITAAFYDLKPVKSKTDAENRRRNKENAQELRRKLEERFSLALRKILNLENRAFRIDTVLIDVPESNKDQLTGLYIDWRSKRTRRRNGASYSISAFSRQFEDIKFASPISAALSNVFKHWGRKIRIYMSQRDLARLERLGLDLGDVGELWEDVLYKHFKVPNYPSEPTLNL